MIIVKLIYHQPFPIKNIHKYNIREITQKNYKFQLFLGLQQNMLLWIYLYMYIQRSITIPFLLSLPMVEEGLLNDLL